MHVNLKTKHFILENSEHQKLRIRILRQFFFTMRSKRYSTMSIHSGTSFYEPNYCIIRWKFNKFKKYFKLYCILFNVRFSKKNHKECHFNVPGLYLWHHHKRLSLFKFIQSLFIFNAFLYTAIITTLQANLLCNFRIKRASFRSTPYFPLNNNTSNKNTSFFHFTITPRT